MSALVSTFGVDLNSSNYELHPSPKDSADILQGSYCSAIRFSDTLSTEILDFVSSNECHDGMEIGTVQFITDNRGKISFDVINESLSNCILTVTKEANINTEIYQTEYDRPPSNAMFLRRKGFVRSKLIIKPGLSSDSSLRIRNPMSTKRVTTTFKELKGSQRARLNMKQRNKRRFEHSNMNGSAMGPPHKRPKTNVTLTDAIGEILYVEQATFDKIKNTIQSRTSINLSDTSILQRQLNKMADYYSKNQCYYLKKQYYNNINWKKSSVLTQSEKQKIIKRSQNSQTKSNNNNSSGNGTMDEKKEKEEEKEEENNNNNIVLTEEQKFESEYVAIRNENMYTKYDEIYHKKFSQRTTYLKSISENSNYFKKMRELIQSEKDNDKKQKMKQEFRQIFESRKQGIKDMKNIAEKLRIELTVIKNRINTYVKEQQQLQHQQKIT